MKKGKEDQEGEVHALSAGDGKGIFIAAVVCWIQSFSNQPTLGQCGAHTFDPSTLETKGQISDFDASQNNRASSRTARSMQGDPASR